MDIGNSLFLVDLLKGYSQTLNYSDPFYFGVLLLSI